MVNLWFKIFNFAQIKPSLLLNAASLLLWRYASVKYLGKSWGLIFYGLKLILLCFALAIREIFCFDSVRPLSFTFHKFLKCHYWFTYSFVNKCSFMPLPIDSFILPVNSKSKTGTKYWLNIYALQFVIFSALVDDQHLYYLHQLHYLYIYFINYSAAKIMFKVYYLNAYYYVEFSFSLKQQRQDKTTMGVISLSLVLTLNKTLRTNPANIHLFKFNNRNTRKRCKMCSEVFFFLTLNLFSTFF